jgi:hypothetical protein
MEYRCDPVPKQSDQREQNDIGYEANRSHDPHEPSRPLHIAGMQVLRFVSPQHLFNSKGRDGAQYGNQSVKQAEYAELMFAKAPYEHNVACQRGNLRNDPVAKRIDDRAPGPGVVVERHLAQNYRIFRCADGIQILDRGPVLPDIARKHRTRRRNSPARLPGICSG